MTPIPFFNLKRENEALEAELIAATTRVITSGWFILGEELQAFEKEFAQYCGVTHAVGVGNGLDALMLMIRGYKELGKLSDGDKVLVPSNSYIATILAITENNLVPILVEPDPITCNVTAAGLRRAITSDTKAIMLLHLYGRVCFDADIAAVAKEYDLLVFEDGAQAVGARFAGKTMGSLADASGISLFPTKNLGALGDAGVMTTDNTELYEVVSALRNYGSHKKYYNQYRGVNSRLDEMQAAVLRVKLPHVDSSNAARQRLAARYQAEIVNEKITLPPLPKEIEEHVWHLFVVKVEDREAFAEHLKTHGVASLIHYPVPPHQQEAYSEWKDQSYLISEALHREVISIPLYPTLNEAEVATIINACNTY